MKWLSHSTNRVECTSHGRLMLPAYGRVCVVSRFYSRCWWQILWKCDDNAQIKLDIVAFVRIEVVVLSNKENIKITSTWSFTFWKKFRKSLMIIMKYQHTVSVLSIRKGRISVEIIKGSTCDGHSSTSKLVFSISKTNWFSLKFVIKLAFRMS